MSKLVDLEETTPPHRIKRKRRDKTCCPFCSAFLRKIKGKRIGVCDNCQAQADKTIKIKCCKGAKIWRKGSDNFKCFTCGSKVLPT